jgi:hypothetical protein
MNWAHIQEVSVVTNVNGNKIVQYKRQKVAAQYRRNQSNDEEMADRCG